MNVLFIIPHLRKGGPVDVEFQLCKQYACDNRMHIEVMTLREETASSKLNDFSDLGIIVNQLKIPYWKCELNSKRIGKKIQEYVDEHQIDIVHCHGYHPVLMCANLKRVKKVATMHDRATEDFINVFGKVIGKYMVHRYLSALKRFDANIGVSNSVAKLYQLYIPHVTYVNNGIDINKFFPVDLSTRKELRERLGLPLDKKIIVSSGRIEKEKHYEELIEWFVHSVKDESVVLLILGNGSRWEQCKDVAQGKENVILPGRVSNVDEYLKCSDYYISNSESEGMSLAVCEGISCGLFPILSDIPSHRDVGSGVDGFFFKHLAEIHLDEIKKKTVDREHLYQYISDSFSVNSMYNGYKELYQKLLDEKDG